MDNPRPRCPHSILVRYDPIPSLFITHPTPHPFHSFIQYINKYHSYVGAQESISTSFDKYVHRAFQSPRTTPTWSAIAHTCFALGRFFAALLSYSFSRYNLQPRHLLLFFLLASTALSIVAMHYHGTVPQTTLMLLYFFEGPIFSLVFANCLRGLGKWTKDGSALLTAAIAGGAAFPPVMYAIAKGSDSRGRGGYQYAYYIIATALAVGIFLPLWQNVVPSARKISDPVVKGRHEVGLSGRPRGTGSDDASISDRGFGFGFPPWKTKTLFLERAGVTIARFEQGQDEVGMRSDSLGRNDSLNRIDTLERDKDTGPR